MRKLLIGFLAVFLSSCSEAKTSDLDSVHDSIETRYNDIEHLDPVTYSRKTYDSVVLFDVREKEEYEVSHLPEAIQIDPDMSADEFMENYGIMVQEYGDRVEAVEVIFYCSVGERSSRMARRIQAVSPGFKIYNLEKGIFGWHNEEMPLVKGLWGTDYIHPYDKNWGRYLKRQDKVSYSPE